MRDREKMTSSIQHMLDLVDIFQDWGIKESKARIMALCLAYGHELVEAAYDRNHYDVNHQKLESLVLGNEPDQEPVQA